VTGISLSIKAVGFDDTCQMQYHRPNINLKLSKSKNSFAVQPPTFAGFGRTDLTNPLHANGLAAHFLKLSCLWN
jgi:hypothetical protein